LQLPVGESGRRRFQLHLSEFASILHDRASRDFANPAERDLYGAIAKAADQPHRNERVFDVSRDGELFVEARILATLENSLEPDCLIVSQMM